MLGSLGQLMWALLSAKLCALSAEDLWHLRQRKLLRTMVCLGVMTQPCAEPPFTTGSLLSVSCMVESVSCVEHGCGIKDCLEFLLDEAVFPGMGALSEARFLQIRCWGNAWAHVGMKWIM